jgi:large subunit ribosomal protein L17
MKHKKKSSKLNRDIKERKALFRQQVNAFILNGKIVTTYPKAKAVTRSIEKMLSYAISGKNSSLNKLTAFLNNKESFLKITKHIVPFFKNRHSGYTKIIKLNNRQGDNSQMVKINWVENIEIKDNASKIKKSDNKKIKKDIKNK